MDIMEIQYFWNNEYSNWHRFTDVYCNYYSVYKWSMRLDLDLNK